MQATELVRAPADWLELNAISILVGIIILALGWYLSRFLSGQARRLLPKTGHLDATLTPLLSQLIRYGVLLVTLVIALSQFGVQTASVLAVLGAAGLAIALALQGTLSNLASGVMILWLRPFNVGESIETEDGIAGDVKEVGLFATRLRTYDGVFIFVPNTRLFEGRITNWTREPQRMVELKYAVDGETDVNQAREALLGLSNADRRVLSEPGATVHVGDVQPGSIQLVWRFWTAGSDWFSTKVQLLEESISRLNELGIELSRTTTELRLSKDAQQLLGGPRPQA